MLRRFHRVAISPDVSLTDETLNTIRSLSTKDILFLEERVGKFELEPEAFESIDALISGWCTILDRNFLSRFPRLKYVGLRATSTHYVDIPYLQSNDVCLTTLKSYGDRGTAEFVIETIMTYCRKTRMAAGCLPSEVGSKRLGLVGFGSVGKLVARMAGGLGIDVSYYHPSGPDAAHSHSVNFLPLHELLSRSDWISFHTPAFRIVLSSQEFELIRRGTQIIVTTLGLPFTIEDFSAFTRREHYRTVFDLCAAHQYVEDLTRLPNVEVVKFFSARTEESVRRAEQQLLENIYCYLRI